MTQEGDNINVEIVVIQVHFMKLCIQAMTLILTLVATENQSVSGKCCELAGRFIELDNAINNLVGEEV